jgi:acylphosphatase
MEIPDVVIQRLTAYASGKVQKTGYRARVVTIARTFGLRGYVQNLEDGRVKVVAEGEASDLESFRAAIDIRNTLINVADIKSDYSPTTGDFEGFFKVVSGSIETDQRLDVAAEKLTELIEINKSILIELKATRFDLKSEIVATREELKSEIAATREELKEAREDIRESRDAIVDEIKGCRDSIVSGIEGLRDDLKTGTEDRFSQMESDISRIKARVGI